MGRDGTLWQLCDVTKRRKGEARRPLEHIVTRLQKRVEPRIFNYNVYISISSINFLLLGKVAHQTCLTPFVDLNEQ